MPSLSDKTDYQQQPLQVGDTGRLASETQDKIPPCEVQQSLTLVVEEGSRSCPGEAVKGAGSQG